MRTNTFEGIEYVDYLSLVNMGKALLQKGDDLFSKAEINPEDTAAMIFIHGTTFAMLSHKAILSNANAVIKRYSSFGKYMKEREKWIVGLPLHHTYPLIIGVIIPILTYGSANILTRYKVKDIIKAMKEDKTNYMGTVPLIIEGIFKEALSSKLSLSHLKFLFSGGAALKPEIVEKMDKLGITVYQGYGLTEYSPVVAANGPGYNKPGSIGLAMESVQVMIDKPDNNGNGEILVKGPSLMTGYYNDSLKTQEAFDNNGWLKTGDIGKIDQDGFIYITGRKKNIIVNNGGRNIYPEDVENILLNSPYVSEAIVLPKIDNDNLRTKFII